MKQSELAPGILVALPNLQDPYFSKTAILLCNYNEEGAFGLVMNHPSDLKVTEILKEEFQNHNDLEMPLLIGGPVQPESFWAVHTSDYLCESSTEISSRIALSAGQDILMAILLLRGSNRAILIWMFLWALWTAILRPLSGNLEKVEIDGEWVVSWQPIR